MSESMDVLLVGQMARDHALASRLEGCRIHVISEYENPGLVAAVQASRGESYIVEPRHGGIKNGEVVAQFAADVGADLVYVGADDPLAGGVVDSVQAFLPDVMTVGPKKEAAQLEWDKFFGREIIDEIDPKYNPRYRKVTNECELADALAYFEELGVEVAMKPRNLAGGKGVKVMGPHLADYQAAHEYGQKILNDPNQTGISVEEKLEGEEYTLMCWTDGTVIIAPPTTFDYPYLEDGDKGPGTGGVGTFTMKDGLMPFLSADEYEESLDLMRQVLAKMRERGQVINGVLYGSFFKTSKGIKVTEFNVRGGDPELINTLALQEDDVDMPDVLRRVATGELREDDIRYRDAASTLIYLFGKNYARPEASQVADLYSFEAYLDRLQREGIQAYFANARAVKDQLGKYRAGDARALALVALNETPWGARSKILQAKASGMVDGELRHRLEIGHKPYIDALPKAA